MLRTQRHVGGPRERAVPGAERRQGHGVRFVCRSTEGRAAVEALLGASDVSSTTANRCAARLASTARRRGSPPQIVYVSVGVPQSPLGGFDPNCSSLIVGHNQGASTRTGEGRGAPLLDHGRRRAVPRPSGRRAACARGGRSRRARDSIRKLEFGGGIVQQRRSTFFTTARLHGRSAVRSLRRVPRQGAAISSPPARQWTTPVAALLPRDERCDCPADERSATNADAGRPPWLVDAIEDVLAPGTIKLLARPVLRGRRRPAARVRSQVVQCDQVPRSPGDGP